MCTPSHRGALALLAAALVTTLAVAAHAAARPDPALDAITRAGAPGALVVANTPAARVVRTAGSAERGAARPLRSGSAFRAGSITKTVTATLVLQLVAERRLRLDDTLDQLLPGALRYGGQVTVRQLLQQTSGIPDYTELAGAPALFAPLIADPAHRYRPAELVAAVRQEPLLFRPGAGWHYANTNYVLLGMILERVTGARLATLVRERIARPLRLGATRLVDDATLPRSAVHGYLLPGNEFLPTPDDVPRDVSATSPSWTWAAGALVTSADDVGRFYRSLLAGRLLPSRLLREMLTTRSTGAGTRYGLGVLELTTPCGRAFGHDGEIFGYTSLALATRDGRRSVVVLASASHAPINADGALLRQMVELAGATLCASAR